MNSEYQLKEIIFILDEKIPILGPKSLFDVNETLKFLQNLKFSLFQDFDDSVGILKESETINRKMVSYQT